MNFLKQVLPSELFVDGLSSESKMYIMSDNELFNSHIGVCVLFDGIINEKEITRILDQRLIGSNDNNFDSIVVNDSYFKRIHNFSCKSVLRTFEITSNTLKVNGFDNIDDESVLYNYLDYHVSMHHNIKLGKRDILPLWRGHLLQFKTFDKTICYLKIHHCYGDGSTMGLLFMNISDNGNQVKQKFVQKVNERYGNKKYQDSKILKMSKFLLFCCYAVMRWTVDTAYFLMHKERPSMLRPLKSNGEKVYSVLHDDNFTVDRVNRLRKSLDRNITFNDFIVGVIMEGLSEYVMKNETQYQSLKQNYRDYDVYYWIVAVITLILSLLFSFMDSDAIRIVGNILIQIFVTLLAKIWVNIKSNQMMDNICCVIPVNNRSFTDMLSLGNKTGIMNVYLPLNQNNTINFKDRVLSIKKEIDYVKYHMYGFFGYLMIRLTGMLPKPIAQFFMKDCPATITVSNIQGPSTKLTLNNIPAMNTFGVVPNVSGVSLSFCVLTYDNKVSVSLLADKNINGPNTAKDIIYSIEKVLTRIECI